MTHVPGDPNQYVVRDDGCWQWQGRLNAGGYGTLHIDGCNLAHRWHWQNINGPVPDGLDLDHLCRNRACCNPAHLEPVTRRTNVRRGVSPKLSLEDARAIRESDDQTAVLAKRYGVTPTRIRQIRRGRGWEDAGGPIDIKPRSERKLTWERVHEIRSSSETATALAEKFGVSFGLVCDVRRGEIWVEKEAA